MFMEINNTYNNYACSYTNQTKNSDARKYTNVREYNTYLTEKYECLTSRDYSVAINGSLMAKAASDEKTAEWLEYNLSLIPETVEKSRAMVEARGAKILSYNITINGYDSMTAHVCTTTDPDGKIEKENAEKRAKEKKEAEEKQAQRRAEQKEKEEKIAEQRAERERLYHIRIEGKDVEDVTRKFVNNVTSSTLESSIGNNYSTFDVMA